MKYIAIVTATLLMAGSAMAQSAAEKSGVNTALGVPPKTEDFVKEAATSDMYEIESSKLAAAQGDQALKSFADQMVADHTKTSSELKQIVSSGNLKIELPTTMTEDQMEAINKLKSMQGADFTKEYLSQQEDAHEDAVDLFTRYGSEGDNPELKAWAEKTRPALQHHLDMVEGMNK
jgi:putative membrane protein